MADMALDPGSGARAEVLTLAQQIKAAQGPEVATMTGWLSQWGEPVSTMARSGGHDMGSMTMGSVPGMMSTDAMNKLMGLKGKAFDQTWLQMMIEHHQGAISMSQAVLKNGSNKPVAALADQIVKAQQAEVAKMTMLLKS